MIRIRERPGLEADYEWSEADEEKYGTGKLC